MTSFSDLSGWAGRILDNLNETGFSTGKVVVWMQNNLHKINLVETQEYQVSGEYIVPEFGATTSGLYEEMYYCDYLNKKANSLLGASSYDWVEIQGEEQGSVRKVSRNDTAKTYMALAKDCQERLRSLISWYIASADPVSPQQQLFSFRLGGSNYGLLVPPPEDLYSSCNSIWA